MNFDNSYAALPQAFYAEVSPNEVTEPALLAWNQELALKLGLAFSDYDEAQLANVFSGSVALEGSQPLSMAYAGHQFGYFVPQLALPCWVRSLLTRAIASTSSSKAPGARRSREEGMANPGWGQCCASTF